MTLKNYIFRGLLAVTIILGLSLSNIKLPIQTVQHVDAAVSGRTDAVVLVNPGSPDYADFPHFIQPYLDNFGIPYTVLNIATTPIGSDIGDYAVIIIGHRSLDINLQYISSTEQGYISSAVSAGAGLINFDNNLASENVGYYQFIQTIFSFSYTTPTTGTQVSFTTAEQIGYQINLWEDAHQSPVLATTSNVSDLNPTDNQWTEYYYEPRGYPGIFGGYNETLPLIHFFGDIPNGEYDLVAHLYWNQDLRYYWGYTSGNPTANSLDVTYGTAGDFSDYSLGTIQITNGQFDLYVQDADPIPDDPVYPYYGWAWVRLVPTSAPSPSHNYIIERHEASEIIYTGNMEMAGILLPDIEMGLAWSGTQPFLTATSYGQGHAVQWGTYDWMSTSVKGPVYGLDDLVWRSIVWAARKPFVMQGMPPFVAFRVDDVTGPMTWANIAIEYGFKPWLGLFYQDIDSSEAAQISALAHAGKVTASIHAKTSPDFFYFDHYLQTNFSNSEIAANFAEATAFHTNNNIPISKYVVPHYYEAGTNVFQGLSNWGVQFITTQMIPGNPYYGSSWVNLGPYRSYETGSSSDILPVYYADYLTIPGHPEFNNQFFNCATEIRDDAGYEWYPSGDVAGTVGRGTRQTIRAFDSMVLASLFTHEYYLQEILEPNWRLVLEGIQTNLEPYGPIYVTMDYACQYARAIHNSNITASSYDASLNQLTTTISGTTDLATMFYVFTDEGAAIRQFLVDAPAISGSTVVTFALPGQLNQIVISPASPTVPQGGTLDFSAMGYDANNHPIPNLAIRWSVVNGGGTIDMDGVFTATGAPGTYSNTIRATYNGLSAFTSVTIGTSINTVVSAGWNMVSVPLQAANMQLTTLFPNVTPPAYYYTTSYQPVQGNGTLATGLGYWMYFASAGTYPISGQPVSLQDIPVSAGWNMIGPFHTAVQVSAITSTPAGILSLPVYGYSNAYVQATSLQPGVGYWAYVTQAGTLHLSGGSLAGGVSQPSAGVRNLPQDFRLPLEVTSAQHTTTLTLGVSPQGSDGFDAGLDQLAPPPGPSGTFDAGLAYEAERYLVDVRSSQPGAYTFTLLVRPAHEGDEIVLSWDADALAGLGQFEIVDLLGGQLFVLDMSTTQELVIQPGSVLYSGLLIRVRANAPRYPMFLPLLVR